MVVLAASIITRGGKALLSRSFREIPKTRIEALLASFPKLADSSTQHTTVEQENVRFVYQPLDELYLVLITNKQSNILQDIDSLHLFGQVVTSICKKTDEREILRNAFDLLSAFDELVTMGYRENLSLSQIKTFLEGESHEERIQEIIARNKELEASEERKRKAKQLEVQRKEAARSAAYGRGVPPRMPSQPTYTPPVQPQTSSYDTYEAEKNKLSNKFTSRSTKGMQLGKKSKTSNAFAQVQQEIGAEEPPATETALPVRSAPTASTHDTTLSSSAATPILISITETLSAKLSREGALKSMEVKGDLQLRITDPSLTKLALSVQAVEGPLKAQFRTHPNVDKALFTSQKLIQLKDTSKRFPANNSIGVLRWRVTAPADHPTDILPVTFTAWVNKSSDGMYTITIEYELTNPSGTTLRDVSITIPYVSSEPSVSSFDAIYQVTGDSLEWNIGVIDADNPSGSFEFEAQAEDDGEFFPMTVSFEMSGTFVDVDVREVRMLEGSMEEGVDFEKVVKANAEGFAIE
ncbi:hypothetical protein G647_09062 [Cladophialophora carrionii CBS 160.54]|uniref:Coatomer subunit delta n=1 Tax=Cladophialophora carrionii CBS 160.54 TaxID=1279043 RepID=V9D231_9EURO|nr:uncharacterized protein G647_09062 [Cladophialophora carrionii CBS 160.54]ETI20047.1 hypothetical protein G647_09062 [Cladophialophora carrionii CBS 160.54]